MSRRLVQPVTTSQIAPKRPPICGAILYMAGIPQDVVKQTKGVRDAVAATIVAPTATNLVVGTWNLRAFGGLSKT